MAVKKNKKMEETMSENMEITPSVNVEEINSNNNMISTINAGTIDDRITVYNALNNAMSLTQVKNETINVVDIILIPGVRKGRNGQSDTECINTYLIDLDNNAWFSQSDGIARSAKSLITMFFNSGLVNKDNPLAVKVMEQKLQNGNTIKSLALDM